ncbi:MAG: hypothetical protein ABGZ49_15975 [Akkermansiaceae bacterium]
MLSITCSPNTAPATDNAPTHATSSSALIRLVLACNCSCVATAGERIHPAMEVRDQAL